MIRRGRVAAAAVTLLALVLGWLAWGSGLDRMSRRAPALATLVPTPLRAHAWRIESALALQQQRPRAALAAAERAVVADPADAGSTSLLAAARLVTGDGQGAAAAFRVAGALGWRDLPTQMFWVTAALQAGSVDIATDRLDALLRQQPNLPELMPLIVGLERSAAGRRALAARLATRPPWLESYLGTLAALSADQLAARAQVLGDPAFGASSLGCDRVAGLARALLDKGQGAKARQLQQRHCSRRDGALIADGDFEQARLNASAPLGWQFIGEGGLDVRIGAAAGLTGRAVTVNSALPMRQVFAIQSLQLAPGAYRISWQARDAGAAPSTRIVVRLTCPAATDGFLAASAAGDGRFTVIAQVPAACPTQWLELAIASGSGAVAVDNVTIAPAG